MKAPTKKTAPFRRDPPDLPAEFDAPEDVAVLFADPELVSLESVQLQDVDNPRMKTATFRLEGCLLERVQLAGSQFGAVTWKDVRLVDCDLANIRAYRMNLKRVELINCRLTGLHATGIEWQEVLVRNGEVRYAQLAEAHFRTCEFEECNLSEADLQSADLTGCILRACNLAQADLKSARLTNTDLRTSQIAGMVTGMNDLRGAIVDAPQAMILARLLGLQIR